MLEAGLDVQCGRWVADKQGRFLKIKLENERGFPDRRVLLPGGVSAYVELKRPDGTGKPSPHQSYWIKVLNELGQDAFFCEDFDTFVQIMTILIENHRPNWILSDPALRLFDGT